MKSLAKYLVLFLFGGIVYYFIEVAYRGYSYPLMALVGGACFVAIGGINDLIPWEMPIWQQGIIGSVIITGFELIVGLGSLPYRMWDYSSLPFNFKGVICLPFSIIWIFISLLAIVVDDYLRWKWFGEEKPHYTVK